MGKPNSEFAARNRFMTIFQSNRWRLAARWFLFPHFIFLLLSGGALLYFSDLKALHLQINEFHTSFFDFFFKYFTHLGDGITVGIVSLSLILFFEIRAGIFIAVASLLDSVVVQFLKRSVFPDHFRPAHYFSELAEWHTIAGVEQHSSFSFPSGHTAAAFCLYFGLALVFQKKWGACTFFFVALLVGLSRVYLSQHFLEDIYVGSIVGVAMTVICFPLFYRSKSSQINTGWQKPLISGL